MNELNISDDITEERPVSPESFARLERISRIKSDIQERYLRLKSKQRRPSLEYVTPEDIKVVFGKFLLQHPELKDINLDEFHEGELKKLFDDWCASL